MKAARQRKTRNRARFIERLEDRRVMSADPITQLLGSSSFVGDQPISHHDVSIAHHSERDADFWIDLSAQQDPATLAGNIEQMLSGAHTLSGLTQVRNDYGFIGTGQTVAIIDSGIAWNHPALGNGMGANFRVVGGWDFTEENDWNPYDDGAEGGHGTHVAGIVGADRAGTADDGVAPGVDLVGLRVFNDYGDGWFDWVENALQWVHQNRNAYENPITVVNLSLGFEWNSTTLPSWANLEDELAQLEADGIFIAVSAGNDFQLFNTPGLSYPAASPHVVPVMSVDDSGSLSYFSQRHTRAIAAPGRTIVSTVPDYIGNNNGVADDYGSFSGTSMAAPYVAGASVLLREAMQFVGITNITQDMLYDHMMNTADTFFDAATNQNYKRLNLANAFSALMPTDDYGSTAATAHNLGTLTADGEISGLIGTLTDADYFTFTAATSGTVAFTATTTHGMDPVWTPVGGSGAVSGTNGETYTFNVVAGQTYTIGLSSSSCIGYYDLAFDVGFAYTDLGTVTQSQLTDVAIAGETWYRMTASRTGYLTAEAFFADAGGNVDIAFYDSNFQLLATGTPNATGERRHISATAGSDYYLKVTGTNADVDFRFTNLVTLSGATVTVGGTTGNDAFEFSVGATLHTVAINGTSYTFDKATVTTFNIGGGAGSDSITMTGTSGVETATLRVGNANLAGTGFSATATAVENVTVHGGGGADVAFLYDSTGDDDFKAWTDHAEMTGTGFGSYAVGFSRIDGVASTGTDTATLFDSAGDDTLQSYFNRAILQGAGFFSRATGFDSTDCVASTGFDVATMNDSTGNDMFEAYTDHATMNVGTAVFEAQNFDRVDAVASSGNDLATLFDSAGNDDFQSYDNRAIMSGAGYFNRATGFDVTEGVASTGTDTASLFDSAGNDSFEIRVGLATMHIGAVEFRARNFGSATGFASTGNDTAALYDSAGDDLYRGFNNRAILSGTGFTSRAFDFDSYSGHASTGADVATLNDTAGSEVFTARPTQASFIGTGLSHTVSAFDRVDAFSTGGPDTAIFHDSAGNDTFESVPTRALMQGIGYQNRAFNFALSQAYSTLGNDVARLFGSAGNETFNAWFDHAELQGAGFKNEVYGFDNVTSTGRGGSDTANLYDSAGNDRLYVRDWGSYMTNTSATYRNTAQDFDNILCHSVNGGTDVADTWAVDYLFSLIGNWT
ncbi:MAG TPA: S8 family serine peptidase [Lacipirellulaceae bacterium]|nr:S8 family serine peptidase [Lacipirellulaceae bacterium]